MLQTFTAATKAAPVNHALSQQAAASHEVRLHRLWDFVRLRDPFSRS